MYLDKNGNEVDWVDPDSGFHILSKNDVEYKVHIPKNSLCLQIGEITEILSGGIVKGT